MAESIIGLFKTESIWPRGPWKNLNTGRIRDARGWTGITTNDCSVRPATSRRSSSRRPTTSRRWSGNRRLTHTTESLEYPGRFNRQKEWREAKNPTSHLVLI